MNIKGILEDKDILETGPWDMGPMAKERDFANVA